MPAAKVGDFDAVLFALQRLAILVEACDRRLEELLASAQVGLLFFSFLDPSLPVHELLGLPGDEVQLFPAVLQVSLEDFALDRHVAPDGLDCLLCCLELGERKLVRRNNLRENVWNSLIGLDYDQGCWSWHTLGARRQYRRP